MHWMNVYKVEQPEVMWADLESTQENTNITVYQRQRQVSLPTTMWPVETTGKPPK